MVDAAAEPRLPSSQWLRNRWTTLQGLRLGHKIAIGLAAHLLLFGVLVATGISGSSMSQLYERMTGTPDPSMVAGTSRAVRSDEWLVATPLTVAQVAQGLPRYSEVIPGGSDMSIVWDVPTRDWSTVLRPQNWGFFFLPLDQAFAWKWWFAFLAMVGVAFVLLAVLWRRALAAFSVAWAFGLSPFFQWWFGSGTFWPPAAALAVVLGVVVLMRDDRRAVRWAVAIGTGLLVSAAAVTLYTPFLLAAFYPAIGVVVGLLVTKRGFVRRLRRLVPLGIAAVGVVIVLVAFMLTRVETVTAITSTVYPGHRSVPTGSWDEFPTFAALGGVFGLGLRAQNLAGYAVNASEGASFVLTGLYLLGPAAWLVVDRLRRREGWDGPILGVLGIGALFVAFVFIPGWDPIAHLLLLDQVRTSRIVLGIGMVSFFLTAFVGTRFIETGVPPRWIAGSSVFMVSALTGLIAWWVYRHAPDVFRAATGWPVMLLVLGVGLWAISRGRLLAGGVGLLAVGIALGAWVNPVYRGVLDLRTTPVGQAVAEVQQETPGNWLALDGHVQTAVLRESGVTAYSGVQLYPTMQMWGAIDPGSHYEEIWNRYAHVDWTVVDLEASAIALAQEDVVRLRFEPCGVFAQENIDHVLISGAVDTDCLSLNRSVTAGQGTYYIYDVVELDAHS